MLQAIHDIAFVLVLLVLWVVPAVLIALLARRKGRSFGLFLIASLVFFWPIPLIVALVIPRRVDPAV
jgi:hypothetical protein